LQWLLIFFAFSFFIQFLSILPFLSFLQFYLFKIVAFQSFFIVSHLFVFSASGMQGPRAGGRERDSPPVPAFTPSPGGRPGVARDCPSA
jgi:hypothetical protein